MDNTLCQGIQRMSDPTVPYSRIRILHPYDVNNLYPLIAAYIQRPSLADAVKEAVINVGLAEIQNPRFAKPPFVIEEDAYAAIDDYVSKMGMGRKVTKDMLDTLAWKKRHIKCELDEALASDPDPRRNYHFARTASAILLSLCKNITVLHIGPVNWMPLEWFLLQSNYGRLKRPGLQKLERVVFLPMPGNYRVSGYEEEYDELEFLDFVRSFHRLPALRSIVIEGAMGYDSDPGLLLPRTSDVKELRIEHCAIDSATLGRIIRVPKSLEVISISIGGLDDPFGRSPPIRPKTLGKCLLEHKETLKTLQLDLDSAMGSLSFHPTQRRWRETGELEEPGEPEDGRDEPFSDDDEDSEDLDAFYHLDEAISDGPIWSIDLPDTRKYGYTIGSLHDFTALTHLRIGVRALMGPKATGPSTFTSSDHLAEELPFRLIDALPPSLKSFTLTGYVKGRMPEIDDHVDEFMKKKGERLPKLMEVKGIDGTVEDLRLFEGYNQDRTFEEKRFWERPVVNWDWLEA